MHRNKPAYPGIRIDDEGRTKHEPGMTLRDYWAMEFVKLMWDEYKNDPNLKLRAYKHADKMAEARDADQYL